MFFKLINEKLLLSEQDGSNFLRSLLFNFFQGVIGVMITAQALSLFLINFEAIDLSYTYFYVGIIT